MATGWAPEICGRHSTIFTSAMCPFPRWSVETRSHGLPATGAYRLMWKTAINEVTMQIQIKLQVW